jgi:hypothetical protein
MITVELERVEVLEVLGMVMAYLGEPRLDPLSPRIALLESVRDKLGLALREES